mgnify:CR=1 FL=1
MFKVNEYFGGKVVSIGFQTETLPATVGVMAPGEHEFCPNKKETLTVVSGALTVKLPDQDSASAFADQRLAVISVNEAVF